MTEAEALAILQETEAIETVKSTEERVKPTYQKGLEGAGAYIADTGKKAVKGALLGNPLTQGTVTDRAINIIYGKETPLGKVAKTGTDIAMMGAMPVMGAINAAKNVLEKTGVSQKVIDSLDKRGLLPKTKEDLKQWIKEISILPLQAATLPGGTGVSGIMAMSGADKAVQKKIEESKLNPEVLELLGLGAGLAVGKLPIKSKTAVSVGQNIGKGAERTAGAVGEELLTAAEGAATGAREAYKTAKGLVMKEPLNVKSVDNVVKNINGISKQLKKEGSYIPEYDKMFNTAIDEITRAKNMEQLLNKRQTIKKRLNIEYPNNPDFAETILMKIDRTVNDEIYNNLKNPVIKGQWKTANKNYGETEQAFKTLKNIPEGTPERIFSKVVDGGVQKIDSLKRLSSPEQVKQAGFNYISEKVIDINGNFSGAGYKRIIKQMGDDRGKAIFGDDWGKMKDFTKSIDMVETPANLIDMIPVINKFGVKEMVKIATKGNMNRLLTKPEIVQKATLAPAISGATLGLDVKR